MRIIVALCLLVACRMPPPDSKLGRMISCGSNAVQENYHKILPSVNTCLGDAAEHEGCLLGLINPAAGVIEDVLACVLRDQGARFADSANRNPGDKRSVIAAERARSFMGKRGYQFTDSGP